MTGLIQDPIHYGAGITLQSFYFDFSIFFIIINKNINFMKYLLIILVFLVPFHIYPQDRYALLIGIDDYGDHGLMGAKNDVYLLKKILIERFEFTSENIVLVTNKEATHTGIAKAFEDLIERIRPDDHVYIHYSGHGSYTCDLNRDEKSPGRMDSTWVPYGVAWKGRALYNNLSCEEIMDLMNKGFQFYDGDLDINDHDIIDDQINRWLTQLSATTEFIVFVSDSCHSGTITRGGGAIRTRGVIKDSRPHPKGLLPQGSDPLRGIYISASADHEKAREYMAPDGKIYGMFSWFWAGGLLRADPFDTWEDIFHYTRIGMLNNSSLQTPQIKLSRDFYVFDGNFRNRSKKIPVTSVFDNTAIIEAGLILGITKGSILKKISNEHEAFIEITDTYALRSAGRIQGSIMPGDFVKVHKYSPLSRPFRVFISNEHNKDNAIIKNVAEIISKRPLFELSSEQSSSDLVLYFFRPSKAVCGEYIFINAFDSLPVSQKDNALECWILTPSEELYRDLRICFKDWNKAVENLLQNLQKYARYLKITGMISPPGIQKPVSLDITIWQPAKNNEIPLKEKIMFDGNAYIRKKTIKAENDRIYELKVGQLLTFTLHNESDRPYYNYLVNITCRGNITPFFPLRIQGMEHGLTDPWVSLPINSVMLYIDEPVREYIRLISSRRPLNIYLLEQKEYTVRSQVNPLEALLMQKAGIYRGGQATAGEVAEWATVQAVFDVLEDH